MMNRSRFPTPRFALLERYSTGLRLRRVEASRPGEPLNEETLLVEHTQRRGQAVGAGDRRDILLARLYQVDDSKMGSAL
jgi:hypothetical protein